MRQVNLSGIDLNLLPALEALLRQRNVTRAAVDVGLSQPAMSRALGRLRDMLGDPLLVRSGPGFSLTPRAQDLAGRLAAALEDVRAVFQETHFNPAEIRRTVRFAASDAQTILLGPPLMARLAREAPGLDVRMEGYGRDLMTRMDTGEIDFAFATATTPLPPGAMTQPIGEDSLAIVMRKGHPAAAKAWTMADYANHDHVGIAILGDGQSELDTLLAASGVTRRIALVTPHFMAAVAAVSATDLVSTFSRTFAQRFAGPFELVLKPPPFPQANFELTLVWSHFRNADPLLAWLRGVVSEVGAQVRAGPTRG
jgi:DNA-binding transcriptional LysR family regulator